jgi:hypothetical protein
MKARRTEYICDGCGAPVLSAAQPQGWAISHEGDLCPRELADYGKWATAAGYWAGHPKASVERYLRERWNK